MMRAAHESWALDWTFKGFPAGAEALPCSEVGGQSWNILRGDLMLPAAVLHASAVTHNAAWMRRLTDYMGVELCPHVKTSMSPELFLQQLADGAWGLTAATVSHVRTYRQFGVQRIILANQLVGRQAIAYVAAELGRDDAFDFYCLVDSIGAIEHLERHLSATFLGRPLQVFIELGLIGGRTGIRSEEEALGLAERVSRSPFLRLRGVEAFEGIVQSQPDDETHVNSLLDRMVRTARRCVEQGWIEGKPILTAGGSSFFDMAAATRRRLPDNFEVILRSGCYIVHDSDFYQDMIDRLAARTPSVAHLGEGLKPALEIWAHVHSRPEPTRAILGIGKRDCSHDVRLPKLQRWARPDQGIGPSALSPGHSIVRLDDHHAYADVPSDSPLSCGDFISVGISHPCTTFDRWRALYVVDSNLNVTGLVRTFF
jgi:D-serine dehydratase